MNLEVRFLLVFYEIYLRKKEGVQEALLKSVARVRVRVRVRVLSLIKKLGYC